MNNITILFIAIWIVISILTWKRTRKVESVGGTISTMFFTRVMTGFFIYFLIMIVLGDSLLNNHSQLEKTEITEIESINFEYPDRDSYIYPHKNGIIIPISDNGSITYINSENNRIESIDSENIKKDVKVMLVDDSKSSVTINKIKVKSGFWGFLFNKSERTEYLFTIGVEGYNDEEVK